METAPCGQSSRLPGWIGAKFICGSVSKGIWTGICRRQTPVGGTCPDCYTVGQFAEDHPKGTYILALSGHVVCVCDGMIWDSWDSSNENILYYWVKEDD